MPQIPSDELGDSPSLLTAESALIQVRYLVAILALFTHASSLGVLLHLRHTIIRHRLLQYALALRAATPPSFLNVEEAERVLVGDFRDLLRRQFLEMSNNLYDLHDHARLVPTDDRHEALPDRIIRSLAFAGDISFHVLVTIVAIFHVAEGRVGFDH